MTTSYLTHEEEERGDGIMRCGLKRDTCQIETLVSTFHTASFAHQTTQYSKMRLIKQNIIEKDGSGTATLLPEEPEDMVSQSVSNIRSRLGYYLLSSSGTATT